MDKIIKQLEKEAKHLFLKEGSGHDIHHLRRVTNTARHLQRKEGGDEKVIVIAAFLHDLHRLMEKETGKFCPPKKSLPQVRKIIAKIKLTKEQRSKILSAIEHHEEYGFSKKGKTVSDIETLVIQDADNLDAIGAIGIGRTFSFGGAHSVDMWVPEKPFKRRYFTEEREDVSTIHHFYSKLLRLKDNMNTATGRKMATNRHKYMEGFLQEFFAEWNGKR